MLIDDIRHLLKDLEPDIAALTTFWTTSGAPERYAEIDAIMHQENFWKHPDNISLSQEFEGLKNTKSEYHEITTAYADIEEMSTLFQEDQTELEKLFIELKKLARRITAFKLILLLNGEHDSNNCYVSINAGAGGTESQDWAEMLLRMYIRFCERERFQVQMLDYQNGDEAGIKSATFMVKRRNAYGLLKAEEGVHRLVRISPYDSNKRRHTSFASVSVTPEVADQKIEINEKDLRIDTYRAGGAGGQHVNKTDSAVRITHLPTQTVVQCQNERSQMQNKQTALKMLMARLVQKQEAEKRAAQQAIDKQKIEWGSQIRSYVLHPYKMVKDVRTGHESSQPDTILDGALMPFIQSWLLMNAAEK